jgi:LysM repeat protein
MSTVRLTRRGRVVVLCFCLLLAGLVAALASSASRAAQPGDPPEPEVAVVLPGDTLWSVAARHAPSDDPYGMIEEIRRLNDLSGHTIQPGQELILPRQ